MAELISPALFRENARRRRGLVESAASFGELFKVAWTLALKGDRETYTLLRVRGEALREAVYQRGYQRGLRDGYAAALADPEEA